MRALIEQYRALEIYGAEHQDQINKKQRKAQGVVYTPVEAVDFQVRSANESTKEHYNGAELKDPGVQLIDPFAGTGVYHVRAIQLGLLGEGEHLRDKILKDVFFSEIDPVAFSYAVSNITRAAKKAGAEITEEEVAARGHCGDTFLLDDDDLVKYFPPGRWDEECTV